MPSSTEQLSLSAALNSHRNRRTLHDPRHVQHPPSPLKRRKLPICHPALIPWTPELVGTAAWMKGMSIGRRGRRGIMRGVYMGYGGLGLVHLRKDQAARHRQTHPTFSSHFRPLFRLESCVMDPKMARANWIQSGTLLVWSEFSPLPTFTANPSSLKPLPIPQHHRTIHTQNLSISRLPLPPCSPSASSRS